MKKRGYRRPIGLTDLQLCSISDSVLQATPKGGCRKRKRAPSPVKKFPRFLGFSPAVSEVYLMFRLWMDELFEMGAY